MKTIKASTHQNKNQSIAESVSDQSVAFVSPTLQFHSAERDDSNEQENPKPQLQFKKILAAAAPPPFSFNKSNNNTLNHNKSNNNNNKSNSNTSNHNTTAPAFQFKAPDSAPIQNLQEEKEKEQVAPFQFKAPVPDVSLDARNMTAFQLKTSEQTTSPSSFMPTAFSFKNSSDVIQNQAAKPTAFQPFQLKATKTQQAKPSQQKENKTGLPDKLKSGVENISGYAMDDVKVHYNSNKPAQLNAHAYAQGTDIHLGTGQEKHLPHEAWHVVQQKQGRVKPTKQMKGRMNVNDDAGLEKEADVMGAKAAVFQAKKKLPKDSKKINPLTLQAKGHQKGCGCQSCTNQLKVKQNISNPIQSKGHEEGCGCSGCSQKIKTPVGDNILQKKIISNAILQLKPKNVSNHTFLGTNVRGGVSNVLRGRLNLVQAELQRQYNALPENDEKPADLKEYAGLDTIRGWQDRTGNHGTGNAVDVNYHNQPYIPTRTTSDDGSVTYGGEASSSGQIRALREPAVNIYDRAVSFTRVNDAETDVADVNNRRVDETATTVYRRFKRTSDALNNYFSLVFNTNYDIVSRPPILNPENASLEELEQRIPISERLERNTAIVNITAFMNRPEWISVHSNHGLTAAAQYERILRDYEIVRKPMQRGGTSLQPGNTRNPALGFLHMPEHFVVAMMDVGNLSWGACEFSNRANGDIHHFDTGANRNHRRSPALENITPDAPSLQQQTKKHQIG